MKQFNLEEYLKNPERKVVTREGCSVRIICTDRKANNDRSIIALVYDEEEKVEVCRAYYSTGHYVAVQDSKLDLFFAPIKNEGFINMYCNSGDLYFSNVIYNNEQDAKKKAKGSPYYVATTKIEWED